MTDLIRNILTSPFWTIGATVVLWSALYFLFTIFELSDTNWKRLEYIWIFTGFLGLLTVINENNKSYKDKEMNDIKRDIEFDISRLEFFLSNQMACFKYNNVESSPDDFDQRQYDQDQICDWSKTFKIQVDSFAGIPTSHLDTVALKSIKFKTTFMDDYVEDFSECTNRINTSIDKFNEYSKEVNSKFWENFSKTFGPILLIIAFAIRLSLTTRNVRNSKKD
jgi:hypothetical protein